MNAPQEWTRWAEQWQQQPVVDVSWLRRRVQRKRWRMGVVVALELMVSLAVFALVAPAVFEPGLLLRSRVAAGLTLVFLVVLQCLYLHMRRGTWSLAGDDVAEMLRLSAHRALAGIRLAWLQIWSQLLQLVGALVLAAPWLTIEQLQSDPKLRFILIVQCTVGLPLIAALIGFCVWYIRRQRRWLQRVQYLLREIESEPPSML
jgi:hypothetical protein